MKHFFACILCAVLLISCKQNTTAPAENQKEESKRQPDLPPNLVEVLEAHGGLDQWQRMNNLCFTMGEGDGKEVHTVDLNSRKTLITTSNYSLGFNGDKVWLLQDSTYFNPERARFYHNLMFYFYAMPFVLADDGIVYSETDSLTMEGMKYPGIKIGYKSDVGDSPDDEYVLYYHPKTKQMQWLGYTVTYGKEGKSDDFHYIKYDTWKDVNGLKLPETMNWYTVKDGVPVEQRSERKFSQPSVTATRLSEKLFEKPEEAEFVE
ncbi:hypothetical protein GCM10009117_21800 [Gangjinia marincola]|uniref:Threonine synthase n=1 Tax=Gangjinia marincola TaxID=578463 RepID=A0ABP3XX90_9FLAO